MIDKDDDRYKRDHTSPATIRDCNGCEDDFYNGHNQLGVKECWHLGGAKMVLRKKVHINDVPPWKHTPVRVPSCFHVKQFVFVEANREY